MTPRNAAFRRWGIASVVGLTLASAWTAVGGAQASPSAGGAGPRRSWAFSVDGGSQYESNVRFGGGTDQGDLHHRVSARASAGIVRALGSIAVDASGDVIRYGELRDLDRITYDFGMRASRSFSGRFSGAFDARALTSVAGGGADESNPALLPLTVAHTKTAAVSTTWRATPRTTETIDLNHSRTSFDSPGYVGGQVTNGRVEVARRVSAATSLGLVIDGNLAVLGDRDFLTTGLSGSWSHAAGAYHVRLRAGGAMLAAEGAPQRNVLLAGEGEARRDGLRSSLSLRFSHGVTQTFGVGRALSTDQVSLSVDRRWRAGATWRATVDQSWSRDPSQVLQDLETSSVNSEFRVPLPGKTWLGVGGFFRKRSFGDVVDNRGVYVSAGFLTRG